MFLAIDSQIDVITNSSTEIYASCSPHHLDNIKELFSKILNISGCQKKLEEVFEFKLFFNPLLVFEYIDHHEDIHRYKFNTDNTLPKDMCKYEELLERYCIENNIIKENIEKWCYKNLDRCEECKMMLYVFYNREDGKKEFIDMCDTIMHCFEFDAIYQG